MYTIVGLIFDIIGVIILFEYGLPSKLRIHGGSLLSEESNEEEICREKYNKRIRLMARIGLMFLLLGFIFQLIGTILK